MCRLFDTKRFTVALGYGMFIRGSALIVGAPLAGKTLTTVVKAKYLNVHFTLKSDNRQELYLSLLV